MEKALIGICGGSCRLILRTFMRGRERTSMENRQAVTLDPGFPLARADSLTNYSKDFGTNVDV